MNEAVQNIFKNAKAYLSYKIELIDLKKEEEKIKLTRPNENFDDKKYLEMILKRNSKKDVIFKTGVTS